MVKVICRIKPPLKENTKITKDNELLFIKKENTLLDKNKIIYKNYNLDKFYDTNKTNYDIFDEEIKPIINNSFYLFMYGHTGSGKTYTIFGNKNNPGILNLLVKNMNYNIKIEALELSSIGCTDVFNNNPITLLEKNNKIKLYNLSHKTIKNEIEFENILDNIKDKRKTGTSKYNYSSSRTHLVINIYYNNKKYVIIDLAGNERKPDMIKGQSYIDTSYINSSLLSLKECFRRSNSKNDYIPYRRSKLTRLLKNIFETDVKSLIITTIHSGFKYQNDTYDTLSYITQFKNNSESISSIKKKYSDYIKPYSKLIVQKKRINLSKIKYEPIIRPKTSPKSISLEKKKILSNKQNLKPLNIKKYDPKKYYDVKQNNYLKRPLSKIYDDYSYKYDDYSYKYDDTKFNKEKEKINNILDVKKNNLINDYKKNSKSNDIINKYDDYKIIDNTKKTNNNYVYNNNKNFEIKITKKFNKNAHKIIQAINHILYSRSIKNYVKLIKNKNDEDTLIEILNGTISTIEVVLAEINKIYY